MANLSLDPRSRRAEIDSAYSLLSKVPLSVENMTKYHELALTLLKQSSNWNKKDKASHGKEKADVLMTRLAHELRLMPGFTNFVRYDYRNKTDDEIDSRKPDEDMKLFALVLSAFPDIYQSYMELITRYRLDYQTDRVILSDKLDIEYKKRDKKRIEEWRTPLLPQYPPSGEYQTNKNGKSVFHEHPAITVINVIKFIKKTRWEYTDGNIVGWNQEMILLILWVVKNPHTTDYPENTIKLVRKTLEVMNYTDEEVLELFKHLWSKSTYQFGIPKLPDSIDKTRAMQEPHKVAEAMMKVMRDKQAQDYRQGIRRFIKEFREWSTENWWFENMIDALFDSYWEAVLNHNLEYLLTKNQKRKIMDEVLLETWFNETEVDSLLKKHVLIDFERVMRWLFDGHWLRSEQFTRPITIENLIRDVYSHYPPLAWQVRRYWLNEEVRGVVERFIWVEETTV